MEIDTKEKALDIAIRDSETSNASEYGYFIPESNRTYDNYMSNRTWESFLEKMPKLYRRQFEDGDGGELKEKRGRYGLYPPKMASYGSSSRLIFNISKDIPGFCFEKQLPTRIGHVANLDGYLQKGDTDIFVEAKCREIYSIHEKKIISKVYREVYKSINEKEKNFSVDESEYDTTQSYITFKYKGTVIKHFDIKQLICHFLGIAADYLENHKRKKIKFIYLIYNPNEIPTIKEKYKEGIRLDYKTTIQEMALFKDMGWLFNAVWEFQKTKIDKEAEAPAFEFILTDQDGYKELFK